MKHIIFLHGWGQDASAFAEFALSFDKAFRCHRLNLPGFGGEPAPDFAWSATDYADYVANYCVDHKIEKSIFVGHSFGGKISALLGVNHPELVEKIVMIAASGLKRKRSFKFKVRAFFLKMLGRGAGFIDSIFNTSLRGRYRDRFGSADYRNAQGVMKDVLVKTVSEDIGEQVKNIKAPTLLLYGEEDQETPVEIGVRYHELIEKSRYVTLPRQDHYSVFGAGRFQAQNQMTLFLEEKE